MNANDIAQNALAKLSPWQAYVWLRQYHRAWIEDVARNGDEYRRGLIEADTLTSDQFPILDEILAIEAGMMDSKGNYRWQDVIDDEPHKPEHDPIVTALLEYYLEVRRRADLDTAFSIWDCYMDAGQPYGDFFLRLNEYP